MNVEPIPKNLFLDGNPIDIQKNVTEKLSTIINLLMVLP